MPGPPPPPPPPPPAPLASAASAKNAVLKDIQKGGPRLRKVPESEKKDRSDPKFSAAPPSGGTGVTSGPSASSGAPNPFAEAALKAASKQNQPPAPPNKSSLALQPNSRPALPNPPALNNASRPATSSAFKAGGPPPPPAVAPNQVRPPQNFSNESSTMRFSNRNAPSNDERNGVAKTSELGSINSAPLPARRPPGGNQAQLPAHSRPLPRPQNISQTQTLGRSWQNNQSNPMSVAPIPNVPGASSSPRNVSSSNNGVSNGNSGFLANQRQVANVLQNSGAGNSANRPLPAPPPVPPGPLNASKASNGSTSRSQIVPPPPTPPMAPPLQQTRPLPSQSQSLSNQRPAPPTLPPPPPPTAPPPMSAVFNRTAPPGTLVPSGSDRMDAAGGNNQLPLPPRNNSGSTLRGNSGSAPPPPPPPISAPLQQRSQQLNNAPPISTHMYPEASQDFESRFRFPDHRQLPTPPRFQGGPRTYPSSKSRHQDAPSSMPPAPPVPVGYRK